MSSGAQALIFSSVQALSYITKPDTELQHKQTLRIKLDSKTEKQHELRYDTDKQLELRH